jgi:hypothetical protein
MLAAHVDAGSLHVAGEVPDAVTRQQALYLARENSGLPIVDELSVRPGTPPAQVQRQPDGALCRTAVSALAKSFAKYVTRFQVEAGANGQLTVLGTIPSLEEKLAVSRHLSQLPGCTCVYNLLTVTPEAPGSQPHTAFQNDNAQSVADYHGAGASMSVAGAGPGQEEEGVAGTYIVEAPVANVSATPMGYIPATSYVGANGGYVPAMTNQGPYPSLPQQPVYTVQGMQVVNGPPPGQTVMVMPPAAPAPSPGPMYMPSATVMAPVQPAYAPVQMVPAEPGYQVVTAMPASPSAPPPPVRYLPNTVATMPAMRAMAAAPVAGTSAGQASAAPSYGQLTTPGTRIEAGEESSAPAEANVAASRPFPGTARTQASAAPRGSQAYGPKTTQATRIEPATRSAPAVASASSAPRQFPGTAQQSARPLASPAHAPSSSGAIVQTSATTTSSPSAVGEAVVQVGVPVAGQSPQPFPRPATSPAPTVTQTKPPVIQVPAAAPIQHTATAPAPVSTAAKAQPSGLPMVATGVPALVGATVQQTVQGPNTVTKQVSPLGWSVTTITPNAPSASSAGQPFVAAAKPIPAGMEAPKAPAYQVANAASARAAPAPPQATVTNQWGTSAAPVLAPTSAYGSTPTAARAESKPAVAPPVTAAKRPSPYGWAPPTRTVQSPTPTGGEDDAGAAKPVPSMIPLTPTLVQVSANSAPADAARSGAPAYGRQGYYAPGAQAAAAPPAIMPANVQRMLQQRIEQAAHGAWDVQVVPQSSNSVLVRMRVRNTSAGQQLGQRIMNLPDLKPYQVKMEVQVGS